MKFQFNKTELQNLRKQLKVRLGALPTLKNKESALRSEIKKFKNILAELESEYQATSQKILPVKKLYAEVEGELDSIFKVKEIKISFQKIAGVKIPVFQSAEFELAEFSLFAAPSWLMDGLEFLKRVVSLQMKIKVEKRRIELLEYARKKTTQKVNLYEKVQIPAFEDAIIKIRRFLDDMENLDRVGQKIVKKRLAEL